MRLHDAEWRDFASDNCASAHPDVVSALLEANLGHQPSYGADAYTERLQEVVRREFGSRADVFPVFNGTGANILALQAMAARWEAVICAETAHLHTDECAAPEQHGMKLITLPAPEGRIDPADLDRIMRDATNHHHAQPGVLSISQSTELGTCYTADDLRAITTEGHRLGLRVHIDGARIANAAAGLGASLRELTSDVGVDVLSFGATKNGGMFGDCIVVINPDAVRGMRYLQKATTQLPSKTRFISAQLLALLSGDLWLRNAVTANGMARRLAEGLARVPGVRVAYPVEANAVFAEMPPELAARLHGTYAFSTWDERRDVVRLMTAFDTQESDVDAFLEHVRLSLLEPQARRSPCDVRPVYQAKAQGVANQIGCAGTIVASAELDTISLYAIERDR